jgi:hypothetical protein
MATPISPESNSNDSKHFFLYYFGNLGAQSYGYVKHRISNPSRKRRETDTQFLLLLSIMIFFFDKYYQFVNGIHQKNALLSIKIDGSKTFN